ncbi:MAG: methyltransferase [Gemmatimonadota bacterium]
MGRSKRRQSAAEWPPSFESGSGQGSASFIGESTPLHEERLDTVTRILLQSGARTILDLGCGAGSLLQRLVAEERFTRIVGLDTSIQALVQAASSLGVTVGEGGRLSLFHQGFDMYDPRLVDFDAATMVETIEHVRPDRLSVVERVVFGEWKPKVVVMTTPNRDYNPLLNLAEGECRQPDHFFEWGRQKFRSWIEGVAQRNGYDARCEGIGPADLLRGSPTQVAVFDLRAEPRLDGVKDVEGLT